MKRYYMLPVMLIILVSLALAPAAQADLVSLTLILAAVWTSGVIVNETVINNQEESDQVTAQNEASGPQLAVAQSQPDSSQ